MKEIIGGLVAIAGFIGMIGSFIAMRFSMITLVVMVILNLLGVITIAWFAGPLTAGAISTGLWMMVGGFIMMIFSAVITAIGTAVVDA